MALGNPITLTDNVAAKVISVTATSGQTVFTVTGGYRINQLGVYRNGVRLVESNDYTALDGASVTLYSEATLDDILAFQIFDDFRVSDAIVSSASTQTISGNLNVTGDLTVTGTSNVGVVTGGTYYGDGSNLSNVISGVELKSDGNSVGTAITQINFSGFGSVTAPASGFSTVTVDRFLTIGTRTGSAVTFSIADSSFIVENRSGGDVTINL